MNNWSIGKRITFGFAAVLFIMLLLGIVTRLHLNVVQNKTVDITSDNMPGLALLSDIQQANTECCLLTYKHIGCGSIAEMDDLEAKIKSTAERVTQELAEYQKVASTEILPILQQVNARRDTYRALRAQILNLSRAATNAQASALVFQKTRAELDPASQAYAEALNKCFTQEDQEGDDASKSILAAVHTANVTLVFGFVLALSLGAGLAFIIIRGTTRVLTGVSTTLSDGANQVVAAAGQVSASSQMLAEGASEQAASIEETSASLEELSSMTKRNAENSSKANDLSRQTRSAADKGVIDMQEMTAAMAAIKGSSDDIAKIIKTIDEIAFQTNILALNAAVEAARAGDAGMGFAVVADEVRNLAQRSAQAAKETAVKIESAIIRTTQGVELSAKVSQTLNDILTKARQVDELAAEVAGASTEQTQGITQINSAVGDMDKVTQTNAATAEETASAAEELNAQAETMKHSVSELMLLVGTRSEGNPASPTPKGSNDNKPTKMSGSGVSIPGLPKLTLGNSRRENVPVTNSKDPIPLTADFTNF